MPTVKERIRASCSPERFARFMKDVPSAKEILVETLSRNHDGIANLRLLHLFRKKVSLKRKIIDFFTFKIFTLVVFQIALEELMEEGKIREEAEIFYPN